MAKFVTWVRSHTDERARVAVAASPVRLVGWSRVRVVGETKGARGAGDTGHLARDLEGHLAEAEICAFG